MRLKHTIVQPWKQGTGVSLCTETRWYKSLIRDIMMYATDSLASKFAKKLMKTEA